MRLDRLALGLILLASVSVSVVPAMANASTPTPTSTPTVTPTPSPTPQGYDLYEPNDVQGEAKLVGVGVALDATLHIGDTADWWKVHLKAGRHYRVEVVADPGGDPMAALYTEFGTSEVVSRDCGAGSASPCLSYTPAGTGFYYVEVTSEVPGLYASYTLRVVEVLPTATPTHTPTPVPQDTETPYPTATPNDPYEPNHSFETATDLVLGQSISAYLAEGDNDFFAVYVKHLVSVRCDVEPRGNVDTNLIVYDQWKQGVGGNDDREPGMPGSSFRWRPTYSGWYYLLVGPVAGAGGYTLVCNAIAPTPTPLPPTPVRPSVPVGNVGEPTATPIYIPTPTPSHPEGASESQEGGSAGEDWNLSTPTPAEPIKVVVYYDKNNDGASSPDEGIQGACITLLNSAENKAIDVTTTDNTGLASFTPPANVGEQFLRISIPYLAFSKSARGGDIIEVEIKSLRLPGLIP